MKVGSLFAGIGGFDLAARWMGWETAWFSEIDPYASRVLAHHWPGVPNHGDITRIDFSTVEPVDMLCGGFPCQDISNAGKRKGIEGERSGLWSEYARAIGELRPRYVVVENVAALLSRGVDRVLGDLAALGYDAEWTVLSAADVGAPHLRERVWIIAYPTGTGWTRSGAGHDGRIPASPRRQSIRFELGRVCPDGRPQTVADACQSGLEGRRDRRKPARPGEVAGEHATGCGAEYRHSWAVEPDVGRVAHGIPKRVDRLRGLGNAIVPQCAFAIFQAIERREALMARPTSGVAA